MNCSYTVSGAYKVMSLPFTSLNLLFIYLALLVFVSAMTYILNKWPVPGLTQLHNSVFGNTSGA